MCSFLTPKSAITPVLFDPCRMSVVQHNCRFCFSFSVYFAFVEYVCISLCIVSGMCLAVNENTE